MMYIVYEADDLPDNFRDLTFWHQDRHVDLHGQKKKI